MSVPFRRSSLVALFFTSSACASIDKVPSAAPKVARTQTTDEHALPPVVEDARPPVRLDAWRQLDDAGKAAVRTPDPTARIAACKSWIATNPEHEGRGPVLAALVDAMLERGNFDAAELSGYVARRAQLDERSYYLPYELARDFHLRHRLPVADGLALLELSRARIHEARQELPLERDEKERRWAAIRLDHQTMRSWLLAARLHRAAGDEKAAKIDLGHARAAASKLGDEMVLVDESGKRVRTLATGVFDELHVLTAAVELALGDREAARAALGDAVGFLDDLELRKLYDSTRETLGMHGASEQVVKAELEPARPFTLKDLEGKAVKLEDLRGKVVLLAFFATWCGPCKKELPALQKFAKAHADKGVVLLGVSIDEFTTRAKIKPFLRENDLDMRVLLEQPEQLGGFEYSGIPALYVIDREGRIAHARTGYDPDLERKLEHEITEIVDGSRAAGRELLTIEVAQPGFGARWRIPVSGDVASIAIGESNAKAGGEVAIAGRDGLLRFSASGQQIGSEPVTSYVLSLDAADLDGDGRREWVVADWPEIKVLDAQGKSYWNLSRNQPVPIDAIVDLDGDGFRELVAHTEDRVIAYASVPAERWRSRPLAKVEAVAEAPGGGLVVQADGELIELDARGNVRGKSRPLPEGSVLVGRTSDGKRELDVLRSEIAPGAILGHDVDGDGEDDIVVTSSKGVVVYDKAGKTIVRMHSHELPLQTAVGDLDGKPGAEIALAVQHFGVVVLGR